MQGATFVLNPKKDRGGKLRNWIERIISGSNLEARFFYSEHNKPQGFTVPGLEPNNEPVVLAGGDGMQSNGIEHLSKLYKGIENCPPVLLLLVQGGGMTLKNSMEQLTGFPYNARFYLEKFAAGETRVVQMDYIEATSLGKRPVINTVDIGLVATIAEERDKGLYLIDRLPHAKPVRFLSYVWPVLKCMVHSSNPEFSGIRLDDEGQIPVKDVSLITIANGRGYSKDPDVVVIPDARVDDGKISVAIYHTGTFRRRTEAVLSALRAERCRFADYYQAEQVEVSGLELRLQADGEYLGKLSGAFQFVIRKASEGKGIKCLVPEISGELSQSYRVIVHQDSDH